MNKTNIPFTQSDFLAGVKFMRHYNKYAPVWSYSPLGKTNTKGVITEIGRTLTVAEIDKEGFCFLTGSGTPIRINFEDCTLVEDNENA